MVSGSDLSACQLHIGEKMGSSADSKEEEDDDEKCGFCIFMKAGGCKKEFTVSSPQLRICKRMCMRLDFWHEGACCNTLKPSKASCSELTKHVQWCRNGASVWMQSAAMGTILQRSAESPPSTYSTAWRSTATITRCQAARKKSAHALLHVAADQTAAVCLLEVMVGARKCSYCSV